MKKEFLLIGLIMLIAGAIDMAMGVPVCVLGVAALVPIGRVVPDQRLSDYAYPLAPTVMVVPMQADNAMIHLIFVKTDVAALLTATDGTGYGNAPIGTVIIQYLAGNAHIFTKETDATWTTL